VPKPQRELIVRGMSPLAAGALQNAGVVTGEPAPPATGSN